MLCEVAFWSQSTLHSPVCGAVQYAERSEGPISTKGGVNDLTVWNGSFESTLHVFVECTQMISRHNFWQPKNLKRFGLFFRFLLKTRKRSMFSKSLYINKLKETQLCVDQKMKDHNRSNRKVYTNDQKTPIFPTFPNNGDKNYFKCVVAPKWTKKSITPSLKIFVAHQSQKWKIIKNF